MSLRSPYGAHSGEREEIEGGGGGVTVHARSHHPQFADSVAVAHDPEAEHRTVDLRRRAVWCEGRTVSQWRAQVCMASTRNVLASPPARAPEAQDGGAGVAGG
jgi:hypothetical protein